MTALDMEQVLLDHVLMGDHEGDYFECSCGEKCPELDDMYEVEYTPRLAITEELRWHAAHVAAVLSAREALVLAEGRAEAWDEGWNCGSDMDSLERNPYRRANPESEDR